MKYIAVDHNGEVCLREKNPFELSSSTPMIGMNSFESYNYFEDNRVTYTIAPGFEVGKEYDESEFELVTELYSDVYGWNTPEFYNDDKFIRQHRQIARLKQPENKVIGNVVKLLNTQYISDQSKRHILVNLYNVSEQEALDIYPKQQSEKSDMVSRQSVIDILVEHNIDSIVRKLINNL